MPDITMCANGICPLRQRCYRSPDSGTQPTEWRQSWSVFEPYWSPAGDDFTCDHYLQKFGRAALIAQEKADG